MYLLYYVSLIFLFKNDYVLSTTVAESWIMFAKESRKILDKCNEKNITTFSCLRSGSLEIFNKIADSDVIPITETIRFTRNRILNSTSNTNLIYAKPGNVVNDTWPNQILRGISNIIKTHYVQLDVPPIEATETPRRRHRHMLPMMMFGVTALGMIMVPIGFQLLAVLGGKALLLAKLALLLASVNGLKRVATSGVHYGLYHTVPQYQNGAYWDRSNQP